MIYFIGCADAQAVKIGTSSTGPYRHADANATAFARLGTMQVGCPLVLELLAVCDGGEVEEAELHLRFADLRIRGEWFRLTRELSDHIARFPKPVRKPRGRQPSSDSHTRTGFTPVPGRAWPRRHSAPSGDEAVLNQRVA